MIQETKNMWVCVSNRTVNIDKGLFPAYQSIAYSVRNEADAIITIDGDISISGDLIIPEGVSIETTEGMSCNDFKI